MKFCFAAATLAILGTAEAGLFSKKNKDCCTSSVTEVTTTCTTCVKKNIRTAKVVPVQTVAYVAPSQTYSYEYVQPTVQPVIQQVVQPCAQTCSTPVCQPCAPKKIVVEIPVIQAQPACVPTCNYTGCTPCAAHNQIPPTVPAPRAGSQTTVVVDKRLNTPSVPILVESNGQVFVGGSKVTSN